MQNLMPPVNTPDNLFHDGDESTGVEGTILYAEFMNNEQSAIQDIQHEVINVLAEAGFTPDPAKQNQLLTAIQKIISDGVTDGIKGTVKTVNSESPDDAGNVKLGSAADADIVTSMTDTTAGRVPVVGWMGIGVDNSGSGCPVSGGIDYVSEPTGIWQTTNENTTGTFPPNTSHYGTLFRMRGNANDVSQLYFPGASVANGGNIYFRQYNGVSLKWGNWYKIYSEFSKPTAAETGALPNPGTLLTSIYDIAGSGIYAALGKGNEKPTEGMPDDSGNTRYSVLATEVYAGQYWVTLISKNEFYVGQVVISGKTANWCRYYNTGFKQTAADAGALPITGGTMAVNGAITGSLSGSGSYASQNDSGSLAPFFQLINDEAPSRFFPILKQRCSQGKGTWSLGTIIAAGNFQVFYLSDSDQAGKSFTFDKSGQFIPSNYTNFDNRYQAKGSYTPEGEAYTKAQSDARYPTAHRVGARTKVGNLHAAGDWSAQVPQGAVNIASLTEGDDRITSMYYAHPQYLINGNWVNFA
ncbi:pyocin knob domain-containing protein [Enterobacter ludwigii]|uniref:pyocin knob domain-containing protein n=1 Tax=Enterobacter ludwigii TaxID=299767 RepID=UPI003BEF42AA